jgi:hypothetical protein
MAVTVSIVEDDDRARKIFANWINGASGFRLGGDWGHALRCQASSPIRAPDTQSKWLEPNPAAERVYRKGAAGEGCAGLQAREAYQRRRASINGAAATRASRPVLDWSGTNCRFTVKCCPPDHESPPSPTVTL